jgi:hypothetical protein
MAPNFSPDTTYSVGRLTVGQRDNSQKCQIWRGIRVNKLLKWRGSPVPKGELRHCLFVQQATARVNPEIGGKRRRQANDPGGTRWGCFVPDLTRLANGPSATCLLRAICAERRRIARARMSRFQVSPRITRSSGEKARARERKRCSRPLSSENMPPRPGTTSRMSWVCRQASNWLDDM